MLKDNLPHYVNLLFYRIMYNVQKKLLKRLYVLTYKLKLTTKKDICPLIRLNRMFNLRFY